MNGDQEMTSSQQPTALNVLGLFLSKELSGFVLLTKVGLDQFLKLGFNSKLPILWLFHENLDDSKLSPLRTQGRGCTHLGRGHVNTSQHQAGCL